MKSICKLNKQIADAESMVISTKKLLDVNKEDEVLLFMLNQDESLLKQLKKNRTEILLNYLKSINSSAEQVISDVYNNLVFEVDPFYVASCLGVTIIKNPEIDDGEAGKCYISDEITIEFKPQLSHNRERFTVAHELGHIIKHMPYANNVHFEDSEKLLYARSDYIDSTNKQEREADRLAGELLIPKKTINYLIDSLDPLESLSTKMLQDLFKVSEGAIYHALKHYSLLENPKIKKEFS